MLQKGEEKGLEKSHKFVSTQYVYSYIYNIYIYIYTLYIWYIYIYDIYYTHTLFVVVFVGCNTSKLSCSNLHTPAIPRSQTSVVPKVSATWTWQMTPTCILKRHVQKQDTETLWNTWVKSCGDTWYVKWEAFGDIGKLCRIHLQGK